MSAKFHLVDLAGSEKAAKAKTVGKQAEEGTQINQDLLVLGRVITALGLKNAAIPYRDSKLTQVLKQSLGGSSATQLIACVSPAECNREESIRTLQFAENATKIVNVVSANKTSTIVATSANIDAGGIFLAGSSQQQMLRLLDPLLPNMNFSKKS